MARELTITCDAKDVPPRLAITGAERCMSRKVEMNGAEPCAKVVRMDGMVLHALPSQYSDGISILEAYTHTVLLWIRRGGRVLRRPDFSCPGGSSYNMSVRIGTRRVAAGQAAVRHLMA